MTSRTDESLVARLRDLPETERATGLERACAEDPSLRDRLPAILAALASAGSAPVRPTRATATMNSSTLSNQHLIEALESALVSDEPETSGTHIAHYKLLQELGEGGFGVVWMAEQLTPIRRRVALKIIKLGMDTKEVIARFEAERQALALMDHPNIAHVFDAGATETGRPYFAMELVRGIAITRYCDENRLSAEARLKLFITVCHAVQHAHQKGVIHRDLKPSNILVTLHDGVPVPKVIDFGIAKATSAHLTDKTLFTQFHAFIGTPAYTSPEQMEMSGLDIDTRSDIYSLGVLLYELLTGQPPFDSAALIKSGLEAMRRTIRETNPPRPSHRLDTLTEVNRTSIAQQRGTEPGKLSLLLRGDLDWIAMRCLEKDRTRRYDSATALAADIERHLADGIVEARPPSRWYQTKKFVRRHKLAVTAAAAVVASLLMGLVVSSTLFVSERSARRRATDAERAENELRQQADLAHAAEIKRAARTALDLANRNLTDGRVADGLAYLVYAARKDPTNSVLGPRIASALASHNFVLPEAPPFECGSRVVALHYSLDGLRFMAGTEDGTMRIFESSSGKVLHEFRLGKPVWFSSGWIFASANDRIFAARFRDNSLAVFDTATGRQLSATLQLPVSVLPAPDTVGLSPDGRWLYGQSYQVTNFWVWDARTGEQRFELTLPPGKDLNLDFSPDGQRFCLIFGDELRVWSLPDFAPLVGPLTVPRSRLYQWYLWLMPRFSPDSRRVAVCDPYYGIQLYDATTGAMLGPRIPAEGGFSSKAWAFSPDGRLLQLGVKGGLRNLESGELTPVPTISRDEYNWDTNFSRDGSLILISSHGENVVKVWNTATGKSAAEFSLRLGTNVHALLSPDGRQVVLGTAQGALYRLRVGRGGAQPLILPRLLPAKPVVFVPEAPARLWWTNADQARVLDVATGREVAGGFVFPRKITEITPGEGSPRSGLRADLKFLLVREGPRWEAWEFLPGGSVKVVSLQNAPAEGSESITFSPTGDLVALATGNTIRLWDLRTGVALDRVIQVDRLLWPTSINFSPDARRLAAAYSGLAAIWDITGNTSARSDLNKILDAPLVVAQLSPSGERFLTADRKGEAQLWDAFTGAPLSPVLSHTAGVAHAVFSPDEKYFVTRDSAEAKVWDVKTARRVGGPLPLISGRDLQFSPDGQRFLTVSEDGNAQIFDLASVQACTEPMSHGVGVRLPTGRYSPDGRFVRTETTVPDLRIWSVPPALREGTPVPEWLLQLATACSGKIVNEQGQLTDAADVAVRINILRAQIEALPDNAPLADWGRWILNDRADRSIAPGFTITSAEADRLAVAPATDSHEKP